LMLEISREKEKLTLQGERNDYLVERITNFEKQIEQMEKEISRKSEEINSMSLELEEERGRCKSRTEDAFRKLAETESQLAEQQLKFEEALQAKAAECQSLSVELERQAQIRDSRFEESWTLSEKISTLESQIEAQESTIHKQSEMMKNQALQFEEMMRKMSSDKNADIQKLESKLAEMKNQVKAREQVSTPQTFFFFTDGGGPKSKSVCLFDVFRLVKFF
jgi:chromosome segregation ATPase